MNIQAWVKKNWLNLPKSTFDGFEVVIVHCKEHEECDYGHHNYSGVGVDKEGKLQWCYSSGCSCNGSCGTDHKPSLKVLEITEGFNLPLKGFNKIDYASMQVDFTSY